MVVIQRKMVNMKNQKISLKLASLAIFCGLQVFSNACDELQLFEGFGIYLGSTNDFAMSYPLMIPQVFDKIYNDLGIR